ncbi:MAG: hypothetical protein MUO82_02595 [Candidatus Thermoplasmatota archaeon]|nr:hypothetical protein [Candidatus Thermoplasmatota archaeon]
MQKQLSRVVDDKEYAKWIIVIPPSTIEKIGWKEVEWLKEEIQGKNLLIKPLKNKEIEFLTSKKEVKISYEEFKRKIEFSLKNNPSGLTWTEIKKIENFHQKVPNNRWVKKLEEDIHLIRIRDRNRGIIWRLNQKIKNL